MAGSLNALGLMMVMLLTSVILLRFGRRPGSVLSVVGGIAATFGLMLFASLFSTVLYAEINTQNQLLIPSFCFGLIVAFTRASQVRNLAACAVALSTFVWSIHLLFLIGPDASYTGNPRVSERTARGVQLRRLREMKADLRWMVLEEKKDLVFPRGWAKDSALGPLLTDTFEKNLLVGEIVVTRPLWHSWLTNLHFKERVPIALWYPGGPLKEGLEQIEYRPLPLP